MKNYITKGKNFNTIIKTLKTSFENGELGNDFQIIYEDPTEALGKIYLGKRKTYQQIVKIFLNEITFYKEYYFNCMLDLNERPIDLTDENEVISEIVNYDRLVKGWQRIIDLNLVK